LIARRIIDYIIVVKQKYEVGAMTTKQTQAQTSSPQQVQTRATASTNIDPTKMTAKQIIEHFGGVSKAIRSLDAMKYKRAEIAKMIDRKYQHVRNVLITPLTSNAAEESGVVPQKQQQH